MRITYIYIYGPIYAFSYDVGRWDVLALPWNVVTLWVQHTISIYVCLQPTYIQFFKEACLKCPWLICGVRAFYSSRMHFMFHFLFLRVVVALRHSRYEGDVTSVVKSRDHDTWFPKTNANKYFNTMYFINSMYK